MADRLVVGGSIAALVAADALAEAGESVRLLVTTGAVGGGFAKTERAGRVLELGVRLLELSFDGETAVPDLETYRAHPAGHRPFAALIKEWLGVLIGPRISAVARPQMLHDGQVMDDLYFTTDPRVLRSALSAPALETVAAQLEGLAGAGVLAPACSTRLADMTLQQASLSNHGRMLHDTFVQPLAEKIVPGGTRDVLVTLRRKIWMPVFWPETLFEVATGRNMSFTVDRPFHTVSDGGVGEIVASLLARLAERGVVPEVGGSLRHLSALPNGRVQLSLAAAGQIEAAQPVLGVSPGELFAAIGANYAPEQARSVICWLEVEHSQVMHCPSLLNVVDAEIPAVRISSGGLGRVGHQLFTVELRHDTHEVDVEELASKCLVLTGLVRPGATTTLVASAALKSFPLPTAANRSSFEDAASVLSERHVGAQLVGGATGFGVDSLGDQIVQGLRAAKELLS